MIRSNPRAWFEIFGDLLAHGKECSPRGQRIKEIEDYQITLDPMTEVFCPFPKRNLSLKYFAGELAWYLRGDRNDTSIAEYSKFWNQIKNDSAPLWNSNYGAYIFKLRQFEYVIRSLVRDKDSRQAAMIISSPLSEMSDSKDKICTNAIMFRIREDKLNMTVQMRSNDAVLGLGYDLPLFGIIYEMVYVSLRPIYPELQIGKYTHNAASFHIYEKHFDLLDWAIVDDHSELLQVELPPLMSISELHTLRYQYPVIEKRIRENGFQSLDPRETWNDVRMIKTLSEWLVGNDNKNEATAQ